MVSASHRFFFCCTNCAWVSGYCVLVLLVVLVLLFKRIVDAQGTIIESLIHDVSLICFFMHMLRK